MSALPHVVLAPTEFDDHLLVALAVTLNRRDDLATAQQRRTDLDLVAFAQQQDLVEFDVGADLGFEFFNPQNRALADAILLPTGGDYGIQHDLENSIGREDPSGKGREVYVDEGLLATGRSRKTQATARNGEHPTGVRYSLSLWPRL